MIIILAILAWVSTAQTVLFNMRLPSESEIRRMVVQPLNLTLEISETQGTPVKMSGLSIS
jgi:hypothetical protein